MTPFGIYLQVLYMSIAMFYYVYCNFLKLVVPYLRVPYPCCWIFSHFPIPPIALPGSCAAENLYSVKKCALCYTSGVACCTRSFMSIMCFSLEIKNIALILCEVHSTL